jgi:hypothetical protein
VANCDTWLSESFMSFCQLVCLFIYAVKAMPDGSGSALLANPENIPIIHTTEFRAFYGEPRLQLMPLYANALNASTWATWRSLGLLCSVVAPSQEQTIVAEIVWGGVALEKWQTVPGNKIVLCNFQYQEDAHTHCTFGVSAFTCR